MDFTKIIHPCDQEINGRFYRIFCKIEYKDNRLSISGVVGPLKSGNAHGSCGQIDMDFQGRTEFPELCFSDSWDIQLWIKFLDIWKKWHLNYMHAGCEHQRKMGWEKDGYSKHPSESCPLCGYKYGTAWLFVEVPAGDLDFLRALPDTDKTPAWI